MDESDRGQVSKKKLTAAGAFNEKLNFFFPVSINTCRDGLFVYMHVERKKNNSGKDTNFPMKMSIFLRKSYIFPLAKCYIETNVNKLDLHLRLHIIHVENIFGSNFSAISLVFYCFLLLSFWSFFHSI